MKGRRREKMHVKTTHESFKFVIILAQCFAMFPAPGIGKFKSNSKRLELSFFDFRVYYSLVYLILLLLNMGLYCLKIYQRMEFGLFVSLLFFTCSFITTLLFFMMAKTWPKIMRFWTELDMIMQGHRYEFPKNLHRNLKIITCFVVIVAALEHSFFLLYASNEVPYNGLEGVNYFLKTHYNHAFDYITYSFALGLLFQMISTFTWNFMDLFIMLISTALAYRFQQISNRINQMVSKQVSDMPAWREVREDYNRLSLLCKTIDNAISDLIILSFANNIFIILVQLLNTLEPNEKNDVIGRLYFIYSFGFLILRTLAVCLFASGVNEESKRPIDVLLFLPNFAYNVEVERLLQQIKVDPCCLSGRRFFYVRKSLILSIAGAVVTYELILIQFNIH